MNLFKSKLMMKTRTTHSAALGQLRFPQYSAYFSITTVCTSIALHWDSSALCIISAYFSTTTEVFV